MDIDTEYDDMDIDTEYDDENDKILIKATLTNPQPNSPTNSPIDDN